VTVDLQLGRWTAEVDGHFVVFLIGAAVHDPAVASEVSGLLVAVVEMLAELEQDPSQGLLDYEAHGTGSIGPRSPAATDLARPRSDLLNESGCGVGPGHTW